MTGHLCVRRRSGRRPGRAARRPRRRRPGGPQPRRPGPRGQTDLVRANPRRGPFRTAVANAFGFGGHNVSLVFTTA
ncbi:hypothetical protein ACU686_40675 [Yinghuangia aomiensis]